MPIREQQLTVQGPCPCCGAPTALSSGLADTASEKDIPYFVHWTPDSLDDGIAFLVCLGQDEATTAVSCFFHPQADGFRIIDPQDYDWHDLPQQGRILCRAEVVGTSLAEVTFRVLDEIWLHDADLRVHLSSNTATDQFSEEELTRHALEASGSFDSGPCSRGIVAWMDRLKARFRK